MNYMQLRHNDIANGPGIRTTLFVAGCRLKCKNCFNPEYQDFSAGNEWTNKIEEDFIKMAQDEKIVGISILGGEPLQNVPGLTSFLARFKQEVNKPVWLWTGYAYEKLPSYKISFLHEFVDVLIDGPFVEELKDLNLFYRGSSNQRIIDIKQTKELNKIIELTRYY